MLTNFKSVHAVRMEKVEKMKKSSPQVLSLSEPENACTKLYERFLNLYDRMAAGKLDPNVGVKLCVPLRGASKQIDQQLNFMKYSIAAEKLELERQKLRRKMLGAFDQNGDIQPHDDEKPQ
jgi:hypothetical protein